MSTKIGYHKLRLADAARATAAKLRAVADRLESAASIVSMSRMSEIQIPSDVWSVDAIAGAARVLDRIDDDES